MSLLHALAHWLGWYSGTVYTWTDRDGGTERLMVAFKCNTCGALTDIHESCFGRYTQS